MSDFTFENRILITDLDSDEIGDNYFTPIDTPFCRNYGYPWIRFN